MVYLTTAVEISERALQGDLLSQLLSNLVLDELDCEHERVVLLVRYADDCNVYVCSEKAILGMASMICLMRDVSSSR